MSQLAESPFQELTRTEIGWIYDVFEVSKLYNLDIGMYIRNGEFDQPRWWSALMKRAQMSTLIEIRNFMVERNWDSGDGLTRTFYEITMDELNSRGENKDEQ